VTQGLQFRCYTKGVNWWYYYLHQPMSLSFLCIWHWTYLRFGVNKNKNIIMDFKGETSANIFDKRQLEYFILNIFDFDNSIILSKCMWLINKCMYKVVNKLQPNQNFMYSRYFNQKFYSENVSLSDLFFSFCGFLLFTGILIL